MARLFVASTLIPVAIAAASSNTFDVTIRQRDLATTGRVHWDVRETQVQWNASEVGIIVVDMWNMHWCPTVTFWAGQGAVAINRTANVLRGAGATVIWAPSDITAYYDGTGARNNTLALPKATLPPHDPPYKPYPPFPITAGATNGGCTVPNSTYYYPWTRQIDTLVIDEGRDFLLASANGEQELWNIIEAKGLTKILYAGEAEDMCIMALPFGVNNLRARGWAKEDLVVVRDLVKNMYNPMDAPYVSEGAAQALMTGYVESFWGVTIDSNAFLVPWYQKHPGGFVPTHADGGLTGGLNGGDRRRATTTTTTTEKEEAASTQKQFPPATDGGGGGLLNMTIRQRAPAQTGTTRWVTNTTRVRWNTTTMAVVVVDMWNQHWCSTVTEKTGDMAIKINRTLNVLRAAGATIVFAPSDVTAFYAGSGVRNRTLALHNATVPPSVPLPTPAFPISTATQGGCDVAEAQGAHQVWTRQIATLAMDQNRDYLIASVAGQSQQELWAS